MLSMTQKEKFGLQLMLCLEQDHGLQASFFATQTSQEPWIIHSPLLR